MTTLLFLILSCSSDDSHSQPSNSELAVGTYDLIEININPAQDINEDGTLDSNLLIEMPCAMGTLTLKNDATWAWSYVDVNVISITNGLFKFSCAANSLNSSGSWQVQNNQLTLSGGFEKIVFTVEDDQLTNTTGNDLPNFKSTVYQKRP